jgi:hypothetical protein
MCWPTATATLFDAAAATACLSDKSVPPAVSLEESKIPLLRKPHHPRRKGEKRLRKKKKPPTGQGVAAESKSEKRKKTKKPNFTFTVHASTRRMCGDLHHCCVHADFQGARRLTPG